MQPRLAVLIDAENVSPDYWPQIREQVDALGTVMTCRLFADFAEGKNGKWLKIAKAEALQPVLQVSGGTNACDIAIAIAAMDLMSVGKFEAMCLVSSDGDYTPLAHRVRSAGIKIHGLGEAKTPSVLRKACTSFVQLKSLKPKPVAVPKAA